jgi:hypothetical protein
MTPYDVATIAERVLYGQFDDDTNGRLHEGRTYALRQRFWAF